MRLFLHSFELISGISAASLFRIQAVLPKYIIEWNFLSQGSTRTIDTVWFSPHWTKQNQIVLLHVWPVDIDNAVLCNTKHYRASWRSVPGFLKYAPQYRLYWAGRTQHQLISNINSCLTSPNTLKDLFFPPRYPDIERLADIFEVITVNLTRMFVQWFWYRMETQGSNNLGDFHLRGSPASEKIHQPDAQMETVCGGGKILGIINMKNAHNTYQSLIQMVFVAGHCLCCLGFCTGFKRDRWGARKSLVSG